MMYDSEYGVVDVLYEVTQQSQSDLIFFFIIAVAAIAIILPSFLMYKDRKERRISDEKIASIEAEAIKEKAKIESEAAEKRQIAYLQREGQVLEVVSNNTQVISGLNTIIKVLERDMSEVLKTLTKLEDRK